MQRNLTEFAKVVQCLDPDAYAATAQNGTVIDTAGYDELLYIVQAGDLGTSATLDAKAQEGDASNLSDAADITGAAITQLTKASPDDSNQACLIRIKLNANRKRYHRIVVTPGTAACDAGAIALLTNTGKLPVSQPTYVAESVTV
mgnify:CR=1 FL=1